MPAFINTTDYKHGSKPATGILLTNLGTPDAPDTSALRRYLAEFLSDPRVVEKPRLLWKMVLHGIILRIRPARSAKLYKKVWTDEGSPLFSIAKKQAQAVETALKKDLSCPVKVELGMRYGNPSITSALDALRKANVQKLLILPLYPQYSATTTASTFDAIADTLKQWRWLPHVRMVMEYHQDDGYIQSLANSIREHWQSQERGKKLLMSFHGIPKRYLLNGDPYHCQCHATARRVAETLELSQDEWQLTFQSRFGPEEWLQPYTDKTLEKWGNDGLESVDVICPGFSADCLETLEEVAMENRDIFQSAGGGRYSYVPALNDRTDHIESLVRIIHTNLAGWPGIKDQSGCTDEELAASRKRALEMGAPE
jgi:ferrochelatase